MSMQEPPASPPPAVSTALPMSLLVAFAIEAAFSLSRLAFPKAWVITEKYWLLSTGINACSALLFTMGCADLVRRLPQRQAMGAQVAMVANAVQLALVLASGVLSFLVIGEKSELIWKLQGYMYLAVYLTSAVGVIIAAGGFVRVAAPAIALVVLSIVLAPPPFIAGKLYDALGSNVRLVFSVVNITQLGVQLFLLREAARASTRDLPAEPTAPFALLGTALRTRVIAMFVLVAFSLLATGGRSLGAMKFAMVAAPAINMAAFLVFAVAALRAGRGLDARVQILFSLAGGAAAWCAGVLSMQTPAIYQMFGRSDSYGSERNAEMAQALSVAMPLIATFAVVVALVAVGSHIRQLGHHALGESIAPRTTTFVILMATSVVVQLYLAPKVQSMGELVMIGLLAAAAGVAALLVAAGIFKRASDAASLTSLPTATVLPS